MVLHMSHMSNITLECYTRAATDPEAPPADGMKCLCANQTSKLRVNGNCFVGVFFPFTR